MRKYMAIALTMTMMSSMVSCGGGSSSGVSDISIAKPLVSYKEAGITMAEDFSEIVTLERCSDRYFIFGELKNGTWAGYIADKGFSDYTEFRFAPQEGEVVLDAAAAPQGKKAVLTAGDGSTYLYLFSSKGEQISCTELDGCSAGEAMWCRLAAAKDCFYIHSPEGVSAYDGSGRSLGSVKTGGRTVYCLSEDAEGSMIMLLGGDNGECICARLEGTETADEQLCTGLSGSSPQAVCPGNGDRRLIAAAQGGIYALEGDKWVLLTDLMDNSFPAYSVYGLAPVGEEEIAALSWTEAGMKLYLLTQRDISEIKAKEVITVASFSENGGRFGEAIRAFNARSEDYRIEYRRYTSGYDTWEEYKRRYDDLRLDMISGNAPDIIPLDAALPVDTFNSGIFCDLYELMAENGELSPDDFLPNIRKGLERDGRMVMITPTFDFYSVPAKASFPHVRENWSVDDFIKAYDSMPEGMYVYDYPEYSARSAFFDETYRENLFVDYEKAECHFDSPEFIKLLSFFNDRDIGLTPEEYNSLSGEMHFEMKNDEVKKGRKFTDIGTVRCFSWFGHIFQTARNDYENDFVLAGYPCDGEKCGSYIGLDGCLAIMANSQHKKGAWEFLRMLLSEEYYTDIDASAYLSFPVLKDRFDELAAYTMQDGYMYFASNEYGRIIPGKFEKNEWVSGHMDEQNHEYIIDGRLEPFTEEEYRHYYDLITNAEVARYDTETGSIVSEEADRFFAGECSAEECAAVIQDRVSTYLSERYQ